jgi:pimeloyl-ACP methyl ester carboxylesterase
MRGSRDPISQHEWNIRLTGAIPGARFVEVPGKGHVVMYVATDAVIEPILELARAPEPGLETR